MRAHDGQNGTQRAGEKIGALNFSATRWKNFRPAKLPGDALQKNSTRQIVRRPCQNAWRRAAENFSVPNCPQVVPKCPEARRQKIRRAKLPADALQKNSTRQISWRRAERNFIASIPIWARQNFLNRAHADFSGPNPAASRRARIRRAERNCSAPKVFESG
jgi:hypothetical protein